MARRPATCGLCGELKLVTQEHVVPRGLYPPPQPGPQAKRITIKACSSCNNGTADDDAHFRSVVVIAGKANQAAQTVFEGPVLRGLKHLDGARRIRDLVALIDPPSQPGGIDRQIYPARDERVLKTVRKIVRGLSHYHGIMSPVRDELVFADVYRFKFTADLIEAMTYGSADKEVFEYLYLKEQVHPDLSSVWIIQFYSRTPFVAFIFHSEEGRKRFMEMTVTSPDLGDDQGMAV